MHIPKFLKSLCPEMNVNNALQYFKTPQNDRINVTDYKPIKEGLAEIFVPNEKKVFYNPVQEFNRDLSVAVLQVASEQYYNDSQNKGEKKYRILEALSASGLRSIRYAKEIPNITEVIANDLSKPAIEIIERNIVNNKVQNIVKSNHADAVEVMFNSRLPDKRFQAVDLDPYGCPTQFLDTAVQCVEDGGILLVTCTDMAVLCGNSPETCYVKYGAISLKSKSCHEMAIRIALQCIQSQAAKYKRYIVPVLSLSADFYIRVVVKIFTGASKCKEITGKLSLVYQCTGCTLEHLQPLGIVKKINESSKSYSLPHGPITDKLCAICGGKHHIGGPIWSAPIHDLDFVSDVIRKVENSENLKTKNRLVGVLHLIQEELYDVPLYLNLPRLSALLKISTMPMMTFRSAVLNGGYRISYSHACKDSCKTDAPMSFIWDLIKEWMRVSNISPKNFPEGSASLNILNKPKEYEVDLSLRPDANPVSRKNKMLRYQINPEPFWGPGTRSSCNTDKSDKKVKNQNKRKRRFKPLEGDSEENVKKKLTVDEEKVENC